MSPLQSLRVLSLVALLGLAAGSASVVSADPPPGPTHTPEQIAAAVAELKAAFEADDEAALVEAIHGAADIEDAAIIKLLVKATNDPSRATESAALEALGGNDHPDALKALHRLFKVDKSLRDDEALFVTLLRAIGRHADPSSVAILVEDPFDHLTLEVGRARIMGLANIRTKAAAKALIDAMKLASPGSSRRVIGVASEPFMKWGRAAMEILTGFDAGPSKAEWQEWWRKNDDKVEIAAKPPVVSEASHLEWEKFWGRPYPAPLPDIHPEGPRVSVSDPSPEAVDAAVAELESAVKDGDEVDAIAAVRKVGLLLAPDAAEALGRLHKVRSTALATAAFEALGWMPTKEALKQLHGIYRRSQRIRDDEYLLPVLLKAIGRHSDKSSLEILKNKPMHNLTHASGTARILGLARIRDNDSIEALMRGMMLAGSDTRRRSMIVGAPRFGHEFRLALVVLTGNDLGVGKTPWLDWWRDAKKSFKMSEARPPIDPALRRAWEAYWGEPYMGR